MQSAFSFHNRTKFNVFLYSLSSSDNSPYRKKIESEAGRGFVDVAGWETKKIVERIVGDGIHIREISDFINLADRD
jgi:protein O-GlcNAc transferase